MSTKKFLKHILLTLLLILLFYQYGCNVYKPLTKKDQIVMDIWPIVNEIQKEKITNINSIEELEIYMENMWENLDPIPETDKNELLEEYKKRLEHVRNYYPNFRRGRHSDRARVFLIYGQPDDINYINWIQNPNLMGSDIKAFEIWTYESISTSKHFSTFFDEMNPNIVKFVFADIYGVGRYTQLYSNVPGERIDPKIYRYSDKIEGELDEYIK